MRKVLITIIKIITYFIGFALLASIPIDIKNPTLWRLSAEVIPLLAVILITIVFVRFIDKNKVKIRYIGKNPLQEIFFGGIIGITWIGIVILILFSTSSLKIEGKNSVPMLGIWVIALVLNAFMQELLIRGYMYELIKKEYNTVSAIIVTTVIFVGFHGGAFEAGIIAVLNVATMSIFMSLLLERRNSILEIGIIHAVWNLVGGILIDGVSLASDYPHIYNTAFRGAFGIEGSIVVTVVNVLMIVIVLIRLKKTA